MAITIIEVEKNPLEDLGVHVSLCGHDEDPDPTHPGMVRRTFVGFVEANSAANAITEVRAFVESVATWLGWTTGDVYLHVPAVVVTEGGPSFEIRPVVWVYTTPIV